MGKVVGKIEVVKEVDNTSAINEELVAKVAELEAILETINAEKEELVKTNEELVAKVAELEAKKEKKATKPEE